MASFHEITDWLVKDCCVKELHDLSTLRDILQVGDLLFDSNHLINHRRIIIEALQLSCKSPS